MTLRYHGNKNFWTSTIFLDRDDHLHCRTTEENCEATVCWDREIWLPWQRDVTTSPIYRVRVRWRLWAAHTYPKFKGVPPLETLTRNVSSSLGSLTVTAFPLTASFRVCSSVGDVELVDSKATDGLLRILTCPFLDIGARCFRLVWGDRWTLFTPLSWCSFDSESSELLFSNKKS